MNGTASRSQNEKGMNYRINWGVQLADLQRLAADYPKDVVLASSLWEEDIRECRIMALLLMPPEEVSEAVADSWTTRLETQELAELSAFYLFQYIPDAAKVAFRWLKGPQTLRRLCAYSMLSRLSRSGLTLDESQRLLLKRQAEKDLAGASLSLAHAANNCLFRFF